MPNIFFSKKVDLKKQQILWKKNKKSDERTAVGECSELLLDFLLGKIPCYGLTYGERRRKILAINLFSRILNRMILVTICQPHQRRKGDPVPSQEMISNCGDIKELHM